MFLWEKTGGKWRKLMGKRTKAQRLKDTNKFKPHQGKKEIAKRLKKVKEIK